MALTRSWENKRADIKAKAFAIGKEEVKIGRGTKRTANSQLDLAKVDPYHVWVNETRSVKQATKTYGEEANFKRYLMKFRKLRDKETVII